MTYETERQVLDLIATDRIHIPISSLSGKLKRSMPKLGRLIDLTDCQDNFDGDRCYARIEHENKEKARGMREGIEEFKQRHPKYGAELQEIIDEKRTKRETHLYFGMHEGARVSASDYMDVMTNLGFSEGMARNLYPELMDVSRKLSRARSEERSVMIG